MYTPYYVTADGRACPETELLGPFTSEAVALRTLLEHSFCLKVDKVLSWEREQANDAESQNESDRHDVDDAQPKSESDQNFAKWCDRWLHEHSQALKKQRQKRENFPHAVDVMMRFYYQEKESKLCHNVECNCLC